jgi:hypothetical protein
MHMRRTELYKAVWADPVLHVAKRLGFSDRGLAEVCKRANIPTPPRGHWRRLQTGQPVIATPLPNPEDDSDVGIVGTPKRVGGPVAPARVEPELRPATDPLQPSD